jgi:hypothetical protein
VILEGIQVQERQHRLIDLLGAAFTPADGKQLSEPRKDFSHLLVFYCAEVNGDEALVHGEELADLHYAPFR